MWWKQKMEFNHRLWYADQIKKIVWQWRLSWPGKENLKKQKVWIRFSFRLFLASFHFRFYCYFSLPEGRWRKSILHNNITEITLKNFKGRKVNLQFHHLTINFIFPCLFFLSVCDGLCFVFCWLCCLERKHFLVLHFINCYPVILNIFESILYLTIPEKSNNLMKIF